MTGRHPTQGTVEVDVEGTTYTGQYVVERGVITVTNPMLGQKPTHFVPGSNPEVIAQHLLTALVAESKGEAK